MILLVTVIAGAGYGGIQTVNELFMDAARQARIPGVIVSRHDPPDAEWLADWPGSLCAGGNVPKLLAGGLRRYRHAGSSVILATHVGLAPLARSLKALSGGRFLMFLHGVEAWGALPRATRWGLRACDLLVPNSRFTLDKFYASHAEFAAKPGEVCYLPARLLPSDDEPRERKLRVLTVGRLWGRGMRKGQKQIITLWPRILREFPGAEYWIIGGGEGQAELAQLAAQQGVTQAVKFTGAIPDAELSELYRASAVYAMPSWGEGFGLVFADAMAHGLPCIASADDAGREVVTDGVTGLHVDPEDMEAIYQALVRLLRDKDLRERLGAAGRERADGVFSLASFANRAARLLHKRS
jgi:phosphatidylinositol alpha-1,6-mannosyltransferase